MTKVEKIVEKQLFETNNVFSHQIALFHRRAFFVLSGPDGLKIIHHLLLAAESEMEVVEVFTVLLAVVTSLKIQMRWRLLT